MPLDTDHQCNSPPWVTLTLCREILVWQIIYQNKGNLRQNLPIVKSSWNSPFPPKNPYVLRHHLTCSPLIHKHNFLLQFSLHHSASQAPVAFYLGSVQTLISQDTQLYTCACEEKGLLSLGIAAWGRSFCSVFSAMHSGGQSFTVWGREHLGLSQSEYQMMIVSMKEKPTGFYILYIQEKSSLGSV